MKKVGTLNAKPAPGVLFGEALSRFEEAVRDLSWAGSQPPMDRHLLQERYDAKRKALVDYVVALETKP